MWWHSWYNYIHSLVIVLNIRPFIKPPYFINKKPLYLVDFIHWEPKGPFTLTCCRQQKCCCCQFAPKFNTFNFGANLCYRNMAERKGGCLTADCKQSIRNTEIASRYWWLSYYFVNKTARYQKHSQSQPRVWSTARFPKHSQFLGAAACAPHFRQHWSMCTSLEASTGVAPEMQ